MGNLDLVEQLSNDDADCRSRRNRRDARTWCASILGNLVFRNNLALMMLVVVSRNSRELVFL